MRVPLVNVAHYAQVHQPQEVFFGSVMAGQIGAANNGWNCVIFHGLHGLDAGSGFSPLCLQGNLEQAMFARQVAKQSNAGTTGCEIQDTPSMS